MAASSGGSRCQTPSQQHPVSLLWQHPNAFEAFQIASASDGERPVKASHPHPENYLCSAGSISKSSDELGTMQLCNNSIFHICSKTLVGPERGQLPRPVSICSQKRVYLEAGAMPTHRLYCRGVRHHEAGAWLLQYPGPSSPLQQHQHQISPAQRRFE